MNPIATKYFNEGMIEYNKKDFHISSKKFSEAIGAMPNDAKLFYYRGFSSFKRCSVNSKQSPLWRFCMLTEAITYITEAINIDKKNHKYRITLGNAYMRRGDIIYDYLDFLALLIIGNQTNKKLIAKRLINIQDDYHNAEISFRNALKLSFNRISSYKMKLNKAIAESNKFQSKKNSFLSKI
jgi:hypothetical protein